MSVPISPLFERARVMQDQADEIVRPPTTYWKDAWERLKKNPMAIIGLIIVVVICIAAIIGPVLSPYTYDEQDLVMNNKPPSREHWFGTDNLGRDLLTRVLYGARISLTVGVLASLIALGIGVPYGAISGYIGGRVDEIMMRFLEVLYGLPFQLYVILLMVVLGAGLQNVLIAIGIVYWLDMARIVRGEVLSLKEREFVLAAKTMGVNTWSIIFRHLVPNAMGPIIVTMTLMIPQAIFTEAFLSFIGLGVAAPMASWGALASDGYPAIRVAPWALLFPAGAISITMLAFNFLGDGLRDALDPWLHR
jgi:oligopeptide transport system permease protein